MLAAFSYIIMILMGLSCIFFAGSVANTLAFHTGNQTKKMARATNLYTSRILGGIGFIIFAADGILVTPFLNSPDWIWTSLISIAFGALGVFLFKTGKKMRKICLSDSGKKN